MLVNRWQAALVPTREQIHMMIEAEGLKPFEETFIPGDAIGTHRHPFDEVRVVLEGQLLMDIAGTKLLLRSGDRIVVPANTKHSKKVDGEDNCVCVCAHRYS